MCIAGSHTVSRLAYSEYKRKKTLRRLDSLFSIVPDREMVSKIVEKLCKHHIAGPTLDMMNAKNELVSKIELELIGLMVDRLKR